MATAWTTTDLSVTPPSYQMADTDRRAFTFSLPAASAATVTSTVITFTRLDPFEELDGVASEVEIDGKTATVLVEAAAGMDRDMVYELAVTLVGSDGNTETMTLVIPCVA
jgi:hypothetical protein